MKKNTKNAITSALILLMPFGLILFVIYKIIMKETLNISDNPIDIMRNDSSGAGHYGAPRGSRTHKGVDIVNYPNQSVYLPCDAIVTKTNGRVYSSTPEFKIIDAKGVGLYSMFTFRFFYVDTMRDGLPIISNEWIGKKLDKGTAIGNSQNIAAYHGGSMINHIHFEVKLFGKNINPLYLFKL